MLTNRKRTLLIGLAGVLAVLVLVAASPAQTTEIFLRVRLVGNVEVPPGDSDGTGSAAIRLDPVLKTVCWNIRVSNITLPAFASHIHDAPAGSTGPAVITLTPPDASGLSRGCVSATRRLINDIIRHPSEYYVNVHIRLGGAL
jgi:hypothetical protein